MKTEPWHAVGRPAYHTESQCSRGNNAKPENRRPGTGGKYQCRFCQYLERKRQMREERAPKKRTDGMKVEPWHSVVSPVYHTETECKQGAKMRSELRREGMGGKFHCHWCKKVERRRLMREKQTTRK